MQLSDEIIWDVEDRDTGRKRAKVIMKAGDVAAMPSDIRHQGYSPKRSMLLVWENASPKIPQLISSGQVPHPARRVLTCRTCRRSCYIDGEFIDGLAGRTIDVINPADGTVLAAVAEAGAADVDRAVAAAQRAFPGWAARPAAERGRLLLLLADAIEEHAEELARLESLDTGHPIRDTTVLDVPRTAATFRYFGGMADKHEGSVVPVEQGFLNYVRPEPIGVAGSIVPWNFPLMFTSWKLGPALAAGNTVGAQAHPS